MSEMNKVVEELFAVPALEEVAAGRGENIDRGALVLSVFTNNYLRRKHAREVVAERGLLENPAGPNFKMDWKLDDVIKSVERASHIKLAGLLAGHTLVARSLPGEGAIINERFQHVPMVVGEIPADDPSAFHTKFGRTNFHLYDVITDKQVVVTPINVHGSPIVAITDLGYAA